MEVCIDDFRVSVKHRCLAHLLTHAHSDHLQIPKSFSGTIHTSVLNSKMVDDPRVLGDLVDYRWHTINNVDIYVFPVLHTHGSIGFYLGKPFHVLHFGDCRPTMKQLQRIRKALKNRKIKVLTLDPFFASLDIKLTTGRFKSVAWSKKTILDLIRRHPDKKMYLLVKHLGILTCLPKNVRYDFLPTSKEMSKTHSILKNCIDHAVSELSAPNTEVGCTLIIDKPDCLKDSEVLIVPSLLWFLLQGDGCDDVCWTSSNEVKIMCCLHMDPLLCSKIKKMFPISK